MVLRVYKEHRYPISSYRVTRYEVLLGNFFKSSLKNSDECCQQIQKVKVAETTGSTSFLKLSLTRGRAGLIMSSSLLKRSIELFDEDIIDQKGEMMRYAPEIFVLTVQDNFYSSRIYSCKTFSPQNMFAIRLFATWTF